VRASGQRRYDGKILERLALVDFAQECGFTLAEIRQLFHGYRDNTPLSARMQALAARKVQELDALAGRIGIMKSMLARAQRCRCIDVDECGRRILAATQRVSSDAN
jgi:DNA-binding transcriptional MerR regulator